MSMSVGASAANAMSYLQQLLQQATAGAGSATSASDPLSMLMQEISGGGSSSGQTAAPAANTASGPSTPQFGNDAMSALLSAQSQSASGPPSKLFAKLDSDGDGQISKAEFDTATQKAGVDSSTADTVFAKIDANGDGSVSQGELAKVDHGGGGHHHHHVGHAGGGGGGAQGSGGSQDPLDALLSATGADGATTTTATNADGSTTTSVTYADGSKVDMTTPAAPSGGSDSSSGDSGSSSNNKTAANLIQQLIKMQSQVLNFATSTISAIA